MAYRIVVEGRQLSAKPGETLLALFQREGVRGVDAPCGGNGVCGKCLVTVTGPVETSEGPLLAQKTRLRACGTRPTGDCSVEISGVDMVVVESGRARLVTDGEEGIAAAVDIGTTTVAVYLYELSSGELLGVESGVNFQRAYGADVISRISYADLNEGGLENMRDMIRSQIDGYISLLCRRAQRPRAELRRIVIAGNTVMEHIFAGLSPSGIGVAPFTPESLFGDVHTARELGLELDAEVYIIDAVAGYVGGDITAGILSSGMYEREKPCLFLDIGTNGEMAIGDKNGMLCCATAAGPAFEGAEMEFGMSGVAGAISHVKFVDGAVVCEVIGGGNATGVCGSGYIDALAMLLELGVVDETGRLLEKDEVEPQFAQYLEEDEDERMRFRLADGVYITYADVRKLQLAKAAIRAGINLLLSDSGTDVHDVETMYLAGGFGSFIDRESAARIGILPRELVERTRAVGNAAGAGAAMAALSCEARRAITELTAFCEYSELSCHRGFSDAFMDAMSFDD